MFFHYDDVKVVQSLTKQSISCMWNGYTAALKKMISEKESSPNSLFK